MAKTPQKSNKIIPASASSTGSNASKEPGEIGATGLIQYSGYIYEEQLLELAGYRWPKIVRQMLTHAIIGCIFAVIEYLVRQADWPVVPTDVNNPDDIAAQEFIQSALTDMQFTWQESLSEILSMLGWGWSVMEIVLKPRLGQTPGTYTDSTGKLQVRTSSKFDDGLIGWAKWAPRAQETLLHWEFDDVGNATEMIQLPPPDYRLRNLPLDKCLHFKTSTHKLNPEGKALALGTPIPTPDGWTTMRDIQVGDKIYDDTGKIRYVIGKSEIFHDRPCYEIEFSTGHKIEADAQHEWSVKTANDRNLSKSPRILTTQAIYDWNQKQGNGPSFCFGRAPVLDAPFLTLPLDPYLLGYWLGDGTTTDGSIACHVDDYPSLKDQIDAAGYANSHNGGLYAGTIGLKPILRSIGVLGNKHIPAAYLRAHKSQRLALLQGLMDSDGYSAKGKDSGSYFTNTNLNLITGFCELVRSLGGRPRARLQQAAGRSGGILNGHQIIARQNLYGVYFFLNQSVHRLPRKAKQQDIKDNIRVHGHFLSSIRPIEPRDTVCIEVDSPSHLFLAGEGMVPTHNSLCRQVYTEWFYATNLNRLEAIGLERNLAGLPKVSVPSAIFPGPDGIASPQFMMYEKMVTDLRKDEQMGVLIPSDRYNGGNGERMYDVELMGAAGEKETDTQEAITRHETRIAQGLLADFIMLGHEKVGSFALADSKTSLFSVAMGAHMDSICQIVNKQGIEKLLRINGLTGSCEITHGDLEHVDLTAFSAMLQQFALNGIQLSDEEKQWIKKIMGFPQAETGDQGGGTDEEISRAEDAELKPDKLLPVVQPEPGQPPAKQLPAKGQSKAEPNVASETDEDIEYARKLWTSAVGKDLAGILDAQVRE